MFNIINKYTIFKTKFYLFYPIYENIYKNKNFINHKSINPSKIKTIMYKYLFVLNIYKDDLENLNIEHLWCKDWINKINNKNINDYANKKNKLINDLHHLYLANSKINAIRKNYVFNDLNSINNMNEFLNINGKKTIEKYSYCKINKENEVFEPPNHSKDIIIRSFTYLLFRYPEFCENRFSKSISNDVYLKWFYLNKVTYNELLKNEFIGYFQNNINIFVKYPIYIPILFDDSKDFLINIIKIIPNQLYCLYISYLIKLNINFIKKNRIFTSLDD